jgi:hypothetical protein
MFMHEHPVCFNKEMHWTTSNAYSATPVWNTRIVKTRSVEFASAVATGVSLCSQFHGTTPLFE